MKSILDFEEFKKQFERAGQIGQIKDALKGIARAERHPFLMMASLLDGRAACQVVGTMLDNGWTLPEVEEQIRLFREQCESVFDEIDLSINDRKEPQKDGEQEEG